jgi:alpha-tubulin suppressor-like RCC1 family protein
MRFSASVLALVAPVVVPHSPLDAQDSGIRSSTPGAVVALLDVPDPLRSGVDDVAVGDGSFAVLKDGNVTWWSAEIGSPITELIEDTGARPVVTGVRSIDGGAWYFLALTRTGRVVAFGRPRSGGQMALMRVPREAESGVSAARAGENHSLALKNGRVIAWGSNSCNQLNVPVAARSGVTAIRAGGDNSLALKNGRVIAWGCINTVPKILRRGVTQISSGSTLNLALKNGRVIAWDDTGLRPVPEHLRSGVQRISAGHEHFIAWKAGRPYIWGTDIAGETRIPATAATARNISAGHYLTVALDQNGKVLVWGRGSHTQESIPPIASNGVTAIAVGLGFTAAIKNGGVIVWGDTTTGTTTVPTAATSGVTAIAASASAVLAIKNGAVITWGNGATPPPPAATSGVTAIAAGDNHFLALKGDTVLAWGDNTYNQTTIPTTAQTGIRAITAGGNLSGAITTNGALIRWPASDAPLTGSRSGVSQADTKATVSRVPTWSLRKGERAVVYVGRRRFQPAVLSTQVKDVAIVGYGTVVVLKGDGVIHWSIRGGVLGTSPNARRGIVEVESAFGLPLGIRTP